MLLLVQNEKDQMFMAIRNDNVQAVENMIKRDGIDVNAVISVSTIITTSYTSTCYY